MGNKGSTQAKQMATEAEEQMSQHVLQQGAKRLTHSLLPEDTHSAWCIEQLVQEVRSPLVYSETTTIIEKGSAASGIFFVLSGRGEVLASATLTRGQPVLLAVLEEGDYCGEVSSLYDIPATATVRVTSGTSLLLVDAAKVKEIFSGVILKNLREIFISNKYVVPPLDLDHIDIRRAIFREAIQQLPVVAGWPEEVVERLTMLLSPRDLILYPEAATVTLPGDPTGDLCVLIRGRLSAYDGDDVLTSFVAKRLPFSIGEEGLFAPSYSHSLKLVADTPSYILTIHRETWRQLSSDEWPLAADARLAWQTTRDTWLNTRSLRHWPTYKAHGPYLQVEVLYRLLREQPALWGCSANCVYQLARRAQGRHYDTHQVVLRADDAGIILLVRGELIVSTAKSMENNANTQQTALFTPPHLIDVSSILHKEGVLRSTQPSLIATVTHEIIDDVMQSNPDSHIELYMRDLLSTV